MRVRTPDAEDSPRTSIFPPGQVIAVFARTLKRQTAFSGGMNVADD
jgi:hypothetical protein